MNVRDDGSCFACGAANETGLHLVFRLDLNQKTAATDTVLDERFNGWKGIAHGGIISTMLDEAMVYACITEKKMVATANLSIKFRAPVAVGKPLHIEGQVVQSRKRIMKARATLRFEGEVLAEAEGTFMTLTELDNLDDYCVE
ncbi:PaaI family thioesterase [bacterium]|nr:PaaI family thioesterase [bacterium]